MFVIGICFPGAGLYVVQFVTFVLLGVWLCILLTAGLDYCSGLTLFTVAVALGLLLTAGNNLLDLCTGFCVGMSLRFFLIAVQNRFGLGNAGIRVGVTLGFRQCADQLTLLQIAGVGMFMDLTYQRLFVALICVGMGFNATEGIGLHGDGGKDQCISGTEYNQAHRNAQNFRPDFLAFALLDHKFDFFL